MISVYTLPHIPATLPMVTPAVYRDNPEPLNDTIYPGQPFRAKAGDMSTLCPPKCDSYVLANAT